MNNPKHMQSYILRTVLSCLMIFVEMAFKDVAVRRLINPHEIIVNNYRYFSLALTRHGIYIPLMIAGLSICYFVLTMIERGNKALKIVMMLILVITAVLQITAIAGSIITWTGPVLLMLEILGLIINRRMMKNRAS